MAIMQAQKVFAVSAMAGYQTNMVIGSEDSVKEIGVTIFYDDIEEEREIDKIIKTTGKYGDKVQHKKADHNIKWIDYITYYE